MLKSDILVIDSCGFTGSNIVNYTIQHRAEYIISSCDELDMYSDINRLAPSILSKRHRFYLYEGIPFLSKLIDLEKPTYVVFTSGNKNYISAVMNHSSHKPDKIISISEDKSNDSDSDIQGCKFYALHVPSVYGPRQDVDQTPADIIVNCLKNKDCSSRKEELVEWVYVKDLWNCVIDFIEGDYTSGSWDIQTNQFASDKDIYLFLRHKINGGEPYHWDSEVDRKTASKNVYKIESPKLASAIEHTAVWYSMNKWAQGRNESD